MRYSQNQCKIQRTKRTFFGSPLGPQPESRALLGVPVAGDYGNDMPICEGVFPWMSE